MDVDYIRSKRRRSSSISSSGEDSDAGSQASDSLSPAPKYHRAIEQPGPSRPFLCTLPPTCSQPSTATSYSTEEELLRHQDTFHKWVCRTPIKFRIDPPTHSTPVADENRVPEAFVSRKKGWEYKECGKVFPDERLLDLVSAMWTGVHDHLHHLGIWLTDGIASRGGSRSHIQGEEGTRGEDRTAALLRTSSSQLTRAVPMLHPPARLQKDFHQSCQAAAPPHR